MSIWRAICFGVLAAILVGCSLVSSAARGPGAPLSPSPSTAPGLPAPDTPASPAASQAQPPACPAPLRGSLAEEYAGAMQTIKTFNDKGLVIPGEAAFNAWKEMVQDIAAGDLPQACEILRREQFPYQLSQLTDPAGSKTYIFLRETQPPQTGWGVYLFSPHPERELVIEAPHPETDLYTGAEAFDLFQQSGAAALLVAGTNRCASSQNAPGAPADCDPSESYGGSDVAHLDRSIFQATHEALLPCGGSRVAFQIHGHARSACPDLFISNTLSAPGAESRRMAEAFKSRCGQLTVALAGEESACPLVGRENAQGKFLRACSVNSQGTIQSTQSIERFFQLEQSIKLRKDYSCLIDTIRLSIP